MINADSDIKMSYVFPKGIEPRGLFVHPIQINKNYDDGVTPHTYICHAVEAHDTLVAQNLALKAALFDIKQALHANPNQPKEVLFDCCATAFQIAEKAQEANKR